MLLLDSGSDGSVGFVLSPSLFILGITQSFDPLCRLTKNVCYHCFIQCYRTNAMATTSAGRLLTARTTTSTRNASENGLVAQGSLRTPQSNRLLPIRPHRRSVERERPPTPFRTTRTRRRRTDDRPTRNAEEHERIPALRGTVRKAGVPMGIRPARSPAEFLGGSFAATSVHRSDVGGAIVPRSGNPAGRCCQRPGSAASAREETGAI